MPLQGMDLSFFPMKHHCVVPEKISILPSQRVIGDSEGEGVLKAKILKVKYEPKLEFPEGWEVQIKNPLWGEYGYFLEQQICFLILKDASCPS